MKKETNSLEKAFNYEGHKVRTVIINGEPYFVAKDISDYFGDAHYRRSMGRLDADEKGVTPLITPGGVQKMTVINESGLYSLLFNMQPQKKVHMTAEQFNQRVQSLKNFKRWVTHEVLPAIRKTGSYMAEPKTSAEMLHMYSTQLLEDKRKAKVIRLDY